MQKDIIKEIVERHHKALYHPIKAKAARGSTEAALQEIRALYEPGTADYDRIYRLYNTSSHIHSFRNTYFKNGTLSHHFLSFLVATLAPPFPATANCSSIRLISAGFAHVKEAEEAQTKLANEAAAKTQEENGLGIGAPDLTAKAADINAWIEEFKGTRMEFTEGKLEFKSGITKETVRNLVSRVGLWIADHPSPSSRPRWQQFKADLYGAFNQTFVVI